MEFRNIHANCLKLKFSPKSKMPSDKEIFAFFRKRNWKPDMLNAMFREPREYSVYVKFQSEEIMKAELLKCPTTDTFNYDNGECTPVTFSTARGDFKYIRILGLPIEVEEKHVASVLSKFGKIHQLVRERYGPDTGYPILNGVRGAYMELEEAIPSQMHIHRFQVRIVYEGMQAKCFVCNSPDHMKQNCPKRASVNSRLNQATGSYAGIVAGTSSVAVSNMDATSNDGQQASSSRTLNMERLVTSRDSSRTDAVQSSTSDNALAISSEAATVSETAAPPPITTVALAPTTTKATNSADTMDVLEEDAGTRKRVHESTASGEQHDESESSSMDLEAGNTTALNQVKRNHFCSNR